MNAEVKPLYDSQQIKPFDPGPIFRLGDKTVGELNEHEAMQCHENWIRSQFGHMSEYYRPHLSLLLHVIDGLRAELERERVRLAGCGVAAMGAFTGCLPEYDSASLQDVFRLRKEHDSLLQMTCEACSPDCPEKQP